MKKIILVIASFLLATSAFAHPGHDSNFMESVLHPILGWDHLLTILMIGMMVLAYPLRKGIILPTVFVGSFAIGAFCGAVLPVMTAWAVSVNQLVLLSLVGLAILQGFNHTISFEKILGVIALFGLVHGIAHGIELPSNQWNILAGLILSTVMIHSVGYFSARLLSKTFQPFVRYFSVTSGLLGAVALIQSI